MKKNILVTGGAGFIGTNLIEALLKNPNNNIHCLDNYFSGSKNNHLQGVKYFEGNTKNADKILSKFKYDLVFHFGEYSRIVKSFDDINIVKESIFDGTIKIIDLCKKWNAKLIYSASSSKFGNSGKDENLSPYAWMKAKMVEYIKNYSSWYGLNYEICYFYNVYGPRQIMTGPYATVIGIFERQFLSNQKCTVVRPGSQMRDFTDVRDIVDGLLMVCERNDKHEWHLRSGKNIAIIDVAQSFGEWEYVDERNGERFTSEEFETDTEEKLGWIPKRKLEDWINKIKTKKN